MDEKPLLGRIQPVIHCKRPLEARLRATIDIIGSNHFGLGTPFPSIHRTSDFAKSPEGDGRQLLFLSEL
jgi:hypothetical protein